MNFKVHARKQKTEKRQRGWKGAKKKKKKKKLFGSHASKRELRESNMGEMYDANDEIRRLHAPENVSKPDVCTSVVLHAEGSEFDTAFINPSERGQRSPARRLTRAHNALPAHASVPSSGLPANRCDSTFNRRHSFPASSSSLSSF